MIDERLERARVRVRELRGFYVHVAIYIVIIRGLALINWIATPSFWWVVWPMVLWGIGLGTHGVSVFFERSFLGPEWEKRKTRELLDRENREARP